MIGMDLLESIGRLSAPFAASFWIGGGGRLSLRPLPPISKVRAGKNRMTKINRSNKRTLSLLSQTDQAPQPTTPTPQMDPTNPSPPDPPTQPEEILATHPAMDEPPRRGLHDSGAANGAQPTLTNAAYPAAEDRGTDPQEEEAQDANNSADATDANHWQQQAVAASPFRGCVAVPRLPHGRHASRKRDGDGSTRPLKSSSPGLLCSVNDRLAESNDPNLRDLADVQEVRFYY